jgi:hypothetical protein
MTEARVPNGSVFSDVAMTMAIFAILVKRLGGDVKITQEDFDDAAYNTLNEEHTDTTLEFRLVERKQVG